MASMRNTPNRWVRALRALSALVAYAGSLFASRWALGLGSPREDLRPLRSVATDLRYYWRWRRVYLRRVMDAARASLTVLLDEASGVTRRRLRVLRTRIQNGEFADDTGA